MDFISIDFETANTSGDPCSLGLSVVRNNKITESNSWLINPHAPFSDFCISVHKISPADIANAPDFADIWSKIHNLFEEFPIVAHNANFDVRVLRNALIKNGISIPDTEYYCTLNLSRKLLIGHPKYTLDYLCQSYNIELNMHHNCLDDAMACANLMIYLHSHYPDKIHPCGTLCSKIESVTSSAASPKVPLYLQGNAAFDHVDGPILFNGKNFVITGEFIHFTRKQLCDYIAQKGGIVKSSVTKKTNYLLVGLENLNRIVEPLKQKSTKILQAEKLEASGIDITILKEEQFLELEGIHK